MASLFRIDQVLREKLGAYTITKQLRSTVWFAKDQAQKTVVIKSVQNHVRVENERDVLQKFQHRTPYIRRMIDELQHPSDHVTIGVCRKRQATCISPQKAEPKGVEAYIKPDNIFINYRPNEPEEDRFQDIKLGDFGDTYPVDAYGPSSRAFVGIPEWASPEMMFELPWTTATDIWSFGALLISLMYGGNFSLFAPQGPVADLPEEQLAVLVQHYQWFGPFPEKFREIAREDDMLVIERLEQEFAPEMKSLFCKVTADKFSACDRDVLLRIMKMNWRDRPTVEEVLQDEWWEGE